MYIEVTLHAGKEGRGGVLSRVNRWKGSRTGHTWRTNWFLKYFMNEKLEGRVEVTERRRRRGKQLLDDLTEKRGYWNLQEKALDRFLWRNGFGRGY
jgi:hypothetical protein